MKGFCWLFAALMPVMGVFYRKRKAEAYASASFVGLPGLEPGKAGPESAVLPLHHSPIVFGCKGTAFFYCSKHFCDFLSIFLHFFLKKH